MGLIASSSFWWLRVRTACRVPLTTPLFNRQSGGFYKVFEKKYCSSSGDLSDRSNVFHSSPRPFYVPLFFHPTSNGSFWWIYRYGGYDGKPASHILLSQRPYPKEKQVISLDQDVQVCGYFWWMMDKTPLYDFSLPCNIFLVWAIFSFSSFF